jgi:hypothetical protein
MVGHFPLAFNDQSVDFGVAIELTNVGNAPALNITNHVWLMTQKSGDRPLDRQRALCESVRGKRYGMSITLFPGEVFPRNVGLAGMQVNAKLTRAELEEGLAFDPDRKRVQIFVVGCVNYTFPSDPQGCHQTWFMLDVRKADGAFGVIRVDEGTYPPAALTLREAMAGMGRYAD